VLQVDGYAGYDSVARLRQDRQADARRPGGPLVLAYCWSHFRRRLYNIAKAGNAPIASEVLHRIGEIYAIEAEISGRSAKERRADRQARTQPLAEAVRIWLDEQLERVSWPLTDRRSHALRHEPLAGPLPLPRRWPRRDRHQRGRTDDPPHCLEPEECTLRRQHQIGGANWAIIASLIETAKLHAVNPHAWLADTLTKLVNR
jgi:hypothetical protein